MFPPCLNVFYAALFILSAPMAALAKDAPILKNAERFSPVVANGGMVVSENPIASNVGAAMLAKGGNAVDAAVAVGFALAVTYPQAGNLGGGGFMMVHKDGQTTALDYRETAPMAIEAAHFLNEEGKVDPEKSRRSLKATGVPGTVAGLLHALENYGTLTRAATMAPALKLAKDGFVVDHHLHAALARSAERLQASGGAKAVFYSDEGEPSPVGKVLKQPALYKTLRTISDNGADAFYKGEIAQALVADSRANGGVLTLADLRNYKALERTPVWGEYKQKRIAAMPPPSSGGVHIVQILNMLKNDDLQSFGHNSAAYTHLLAESMRRAYADRSKHLGDPGFYNVPQKWLTSQAYADWLRAGIDLQRITPSALVRPGTPAAAESRETTHFSVLDKWGNGVSNTYTLNFSFGNGHMPPALGFLLNNELDDFAIRPGVPNAYGLVGGEANKVEGGKRPLSSMTPLFMFDGDSLTLAAGSPGGSHIITAVLQTVLNLAAFDFNLASAIALPRVHHQWLPDVLFAEQGISPDTITLLELRGHIVAPTRPIGSVQAAARRPDGTFAGFSDPRRTGVAVGVAE